MLSSGEGFSHRERAEPRVASRLTDLSELEKDFSHLNDPKQEGCMHLYFLFNTEQSYIYLKYHGGLDVLDLCGPSLMSPCSQRVRCLL